MVSEQIQFKNQLCSTASLPLPNKMGIVEVGKERREERRTFGQSHLFFHFSEERGVVWKDEAAVRRVLRTGRVFNMIHGAAACMVWRPRRPEKAANLAAGSLAELAHKQPEATFGWNNKGGGFLLPPSRRGLGSGMVGCLRQPQK